MGHIIRERMRGLRDAVTRECYSALSAITGSTRAARLAGTSTAAILTTASGDDPAAVAARAIQIPTSEVMFEQLAETDPRTLPAVIPAPFGLVGITDAVAALLHQAAIDANAAFAR